MVHLRKDSNVTHRPTIRHRRNVPYRQSSQQIHKRETRVPRGTLEIFSTQGNDRRKWDQYVDSLPNMQKDVYYLSAFAALNEEIFKEPASLFRYGDQTNQTLMVTVKRNISDLPFSGSGQGLPAKSKYDISSPYGYGGPVINCENASDIKGLFQEFRDSFHEYCTSEGIVTEFLRLHPLMENHKLFGKDPNLLQKNHTVWIDVRFDETEILKRMKNDPRRSINVAKNNGVEVILSDLRLNHIRDFYTLYRDSMDRLGAAPFYYFSEEFFLDLAHNLDQNVALFLAVWEGKTIAAYWFFHCGAYVDLYLAGSDSDHWDRKANALTIYQAALWAKSQGYRSVHLGGGLGVELDNLFHFKSQFSPDRSNYYMYRFVHNQQAYTDLCDIKLRYEQQTTKISGAVHKDTDNSGFFPAYRG